MEAFASRDFTRYQLARVAVILGAEAQAVAVAIAMPFNFVGNKLWTFA